MRLSKALFVASAAAVAFAAAPAISVILASLASAALGCRVNAGFAEPCIFLGRDVGHVLYFMFMAAWLLLFTWLYLPIAAGLALAGAAIWRSERRAAGPNRDVGLVFGLATGAALLAPLDTQLGAILLAFAALVLLWRRVTRKSAA